MKPWTVILIIGALLAAVWMFSTTSTRNAQIAADAQIKASQPMPKPLISPPKQ